MQSLISSTDLNWFLGAEGEVEGVGGAVEGEAVGGGGEGGEYARFGCVEGFGGEVGRPCGAGECEEGAESAAVESGGVEQGRGVRGGKLGFVFLLR